MLPRSLRLPARQKPLQAKRISTPLFTFSLWPNALLTNRYGFVVSKRIDKRAVVRNRLKRLLRSCIEELHPSLPQGKDMLFVVKRNFRDIPREEVMGKVTEAVREILSSKS